MPPTFSIIIPVYNVAPYLAECLDSVRAQTYADWEARCVDDGSTDASAPLLDTYARLDPRIHITHQRNTGVSSARNRALMGARGNWVLFLDSDDIYTHKDVLAWYQEQVIGINDNRIVFGEVTRFLVGSEVLEKDSRQPHIEVFDIRTEMSSRALFGGFCGGCYPRVQALEALFPPLSYGEDQVFLARMLDRVDWVVFLNQQCYGYRVRSGSVTQQRFIPLRMFDELIALQYVWVGMAKRAMKMGRKWSQACYNRFAEWLFIYLVNIYRTVEPQGKGKARELYSRLMFAAARLRVRENAFSWRILYYIGGVTHSPLSVSALYRSVIFSSKVQERIQRCLKKSRQRMRWLSHC